MKPHSTGIVAGKTGDGPEEAGVRGNRPMHKAGTDNWSNGGTDRPANSHRAHGWTDTN